jgi:anti-anti-sigma factor
MLSGDLDASSVPALETALGQCSAGGADSITLDLSGLRFIDSAGLWVITSARRWCERRGHDFWLVPGPPAVQYVFEVTGLSDVLPFRVPGAPEQGAPRRSQRV